MKAHAVVTPTNKLRWLTIPQKQAPLEEIRAFMKRQGCPYPYALAVHTTPERRVLQQFWTSDPLGVTGEWRDIDEVRE